MASSCADSELSSPPVGTLGSLVLRVTFLVGEAPSASDIKSSGIMSQEALLTACLSGLSLRKAHADFQNGCRNGRRGRVVGQRLLEGDHRRSYLAAPRPRVAATQFRMSTSTLSIYRIRRRLAPMAGRHTGCWFGRFS